DEKAVDVPLLQAGVLHRSLDRFQIQAHGRPALRVGHFCTTDAYDGRLLGKILDHSRLLDTLGRHLARYWTEEGKRHTFCDIVEHDLDPHPDPHVPRWAFDDPAHHSWTFVQLNHTYRVGSDVGPGGTGWSGDDRI